MTPQEVHDERMSAISTIDIDQSQALNRLCEVTAMEAELRATGQRPILITPRPLKPRCILTPLSKEPMPKPYASTHTPEGLKKFDPQLKLF